MRPPTIFGVVRMVQSVRPRSIRSGEKARWKSRPAASPDSSRIEAELIAGGARIGGGLERDQLPRLQHPRERGGGVDQMGEVGLRDLVSGVGTQTRTASQGTRSA